MDKPPQRWYKTITPLQWRVLFAAQCGWMLDAMDVMFYAFALNAIQAEFGLTSAGAGALASVTLLSSAVGGILLGILADRIGRARALMLSIIFYSLFTALTATASSLAELIVWRLLVGIGMGGEWSAGSVLVSETWPDQHRGKAIGLMQSGWALGYIVAAILAALILPVLGWRVLFLIGIFPAFFTLWIRKNIPEPELWKRMKQPDSGSTFVSLRKTLTSPMLKTTLLASSITTCVLFAYWGLFTWMPSFLSRPLEQGGAGLGLVRSTSWIIPMQVGAFLGYVLFGFLADRFGRKPVFLFFLVVAGLLVPVYGQLAHNEVLLLLIGPLLGFFGHGYFSVFGAMLAELFPTTIRGTAQGLTYNIGRGISAAAPYTIGVFADQYGLGSALAFTSAFFLAGALLMLFLPETKGVALN